MTDNNDTADDLGILHPDQTITLAGEEITVREFPHIDGIKAGAIARAMIEDLGAAIDADAASVDYGTVEDVFSRHTDTLVRLESMSTGKPEDWVRALNDADGRVLDMTFWVVNSGFFTRRLVTGIQLRQEASRAAPSATPNSMPH